MPETMPSKIKKAINSMSKEEVFDLLNWIDKSFILENDSVVNILILAAYERVQDLSLID